VSNGQQVDIGVQTVAGGLDVGIDVLAAIQMINIIAIFKQWGIS
jgi:hypothetical protein